MTSEVNRTEERTKNRYVLRNLIFHHKEKLKYQKKKKSLLVTGYPVISR